jgi:hypothetical protein
LFTQIGPPRGAALLRYRDVTFNDVSVTTDIQYGAAPDANGNQVAACGAPRRRCRRGAHPHRGHDYYVRQLRLSCRL